MLVLDTAFKIKDVGLNCTEWIVIAYIKSISVLSLTSWLRCFLHNLNSLSLHREFNIFNFLSLWLNQQAGNRLGFVKI